MAWERKLLSLTAVECARKIRWLESSRGSGAIHWLSVCGMLVGSAGVVTAMLSDETKPAVETLACRLQHLGGSSGICGVDEGSTPGSDRASWMVERPDVASVPNLNASPLNGDTDRVHMSMPPGAVVAAGVVAGVSALAPNAGEPKPTTTKPSGGSGSGSGYRRGGFRPQIPKPGPFRWWRLSPAAVVLAVVNQYGLVGDVTPLQSIETESGPVALAYNEPGFGGECLSIDGLKACRHAPLPFAEEDVEIRTPDGTLLATRQGDELLLEPDALAAQAKQAQRWSFTSIVNRLRGIEDTTTERPLELPNRVVFWSLSDDGTEVRMTLREDGTLHQEVWHNGREAPYLIRRVVWIPANRCGDACKQAPTNDRGEVQYVCDPEGRCTAVVCFAEGTPVQTPSGRQPIETLQPGDLVLAKDPETGRTEWKAVARTFETPNRPLRRLVLRRESRGTVWFDELEATAEHPFYVSDVGWRPVSALEVGVRVATQNGHATVVENTVLGGKHTVFNLEVKDFHTYFVGELNAWVHNTCDDNNGLGPPSTPLTQAEYRDMLDSEEIRARLSDESREILGGLAPDDYVVFDGVNSKGWRKDDFQPETTSELLRRAKTLEAGEGLDVRYALIHPRHDEDPDPNDPPEPLGDTLPPALQGGNPDDWGEYIGEGGHHVVYRYGDWTYRVLKSIIDDRTLTPYEKARLVVNDLATNRRLRRDPVLRGLVPKRTVAAPAVVRQRFIPEEDPGSAGAGGKARDDLWRDMVARADRLAPNHDVDLGSGVAVASVDPGSRNASGERRADGSFGFTGWFDATSRMPQQRTEPVLRYSLGDYPVPDWPRQLPNVRPLLPASTWRTLQGFSTPPERNFYDSHHSAAVQFITREVVGSLRKDSGYYDRFDLDFESLDDSESLEYLAALAAGVHDVGSRTPGGRPITSETIRWFRDWVQGERAKNILYDTLRQPVENLSREEVQAVHDFMEVIVASTDKTSPRSLIEPTLQRLADNAGPEAAGLALSLGTVVAQVELAASAIVDPPDRAFLRLLGRDEQMRIDGELAESSLDTTDAHYRDYVFAEEDSSIDIDDLRPAARARIAERLGLADHYFRLPEEDILRFSPEPAAKRYEINRRMYQLVAEIRGKARDISQDKLWTETRRRLIEQFPELSELPEVLF